MRFCEGNLLRSGAKHFINRFNINYEQNSTLQTSYILAVSFEFNYRFTHFYCYKRLILTWSIHCN